MPTPSLPRSLMLLTCLLLLTVGLARADETETGAALRELMGKRAPSTIPVEKEILRLKDRRASAALRPHLRHPRYGTLVFWALSEIGVPEDAPLALDVADALARPAQLQLALWLGNWRTEPVRKFLRTLRKTATNDRERIRLGAALLRARDATHLAQIKQDLASKSPDTAARALLALGTCARTDLLSVIAPYANDKRALDGALTSVFPVKTTTKAPNGWTTTTTTYPPLKSVSAAALEAASRAVAPVVPEQMNWWHTLEIGPRFGVENGGEDLLRAQLAASARAARARAPAAASALDAVFAVLRKADPQPQRIRVLDVGFAKGTWTLVIGDSRKRMTWIVDSNLRARVRGT